MKKMLQYTRQLRQRRLSAFELLLRETDDAPNEPIAVQLAFDYAHHHEVDARTMRRRLADMQYDDQR